MEKKKSKLKLNRRRVIVLIVAALLLLLLIVGVVNLFKLIFAKDINRLRKSSSYKKFEVGYFTNVPDMGGYIYRFKVEDAKIILIVDTANSKYKKAYYKKEGK